MCRAITAYPIDDGRIADALRREIKLSGPMPEQEALSFLGELEGVTRVSVQERVSPATGRAKRAIKNMFRITRRGLVTA